MRVVRVVQVEVWVVGTDALSILADTVDEISACGLEERVLLSALPRDVGLVYYRY